VIAGSTKADHIRANAAVSDMGKLEDATIAKVREHAWVRNFYS
jgi:hypothetical protein